jgi:hypothetical protein
MNLEGAVSKPAEGDEDVDTHLFCYRHPDRETWVRCGRCDRPICPRCAMQGPVGFRCRDCGKLAFDPLTSFTPLQLIGGVAVSLVGGVIAGFIASRVGFFSIFISFFAGGIIAEAVTRATGYKRGPVMLGVVFGGIVVGTLIAFGLDYGLFMGDMAAIGDAARSAGADASGYIGSFASYVVDAGVWAIVAAGAACAGAWSRLR